jgi:hypothetical protein
LRQSLRRRPVARRLPRWVAEIGKALKTAPDQQKIIILEPDSIA